MRVGIMFSGGKDSNFAIDFAKEKGWEVAYLLSVKPNRTDCYLFHFATVEHTPSQAQSMGLPHFLIPCTVADPRQEADLVKNFVAEHPVDALLLGGTGLQETQIKSLQEALLPLGIEVFAAHAGQDHDQVMREMLKKGYKFMITQIASDGLNQDWLGRVIDEKVLNELFDRAKKFGFHCGGEGGYYDTFTVDGPLLSKSIDVRKMRKVMESACVGHLVIDELRLLDKVDVSNVKRETNKFD